MSTINKEKDTRNDSKTTAAELAKQEEAIIEQASLTANKPDSTRISKKNMATDKINDAFTEQGKESDVDVEVMPILNKNSDKEKAAKNTDDAANLNKTAPADKQKEASDTPAATDSRPDSAPPAKGEMRTESQKNDKNSTAEEKTIPHSVVVKEAAQIDSASALAYELRAIRHRTGLLSLLVILICLGSIGGFFYLTHYSPERNEAAISGEKLEVIKAENAKLAQAYADIDRIKNDIESLKNFDIKSSEIQPIVSANYEKLEELTKGQRQNVERIARIADQLEIYRSNNPNDWRIAQAYFLVNSAFQMGIFEKDSKAASWCLKNADDQIAGLEDPDLLKIREAISRDLLTLASIPSIDTRGIIYKVDSVYDNLDLMPLKDTRDPARRPAEKQESSEADGNIANWKNNLLSSLKEFSARFVEVRRRTDPNVNEFLSPEQINILKQNIQSELLMAKLAVYHGNDGAFKKNITQAQKLIENYYDNSSDIFKANITALKELKELRVAVETPDVLSSYSLFSDYAQKKLRVNMGNGDAQNNAAEVKREAK